MRVILLFFLISRFGGLPAQEVGLVVVQEESSEEQDIGSLDLNATDALTLRQLTSLSDRKIQALLAYREKFGALVSPAELQVIRELTLEDIRSLLKVFYITPNSPDMHAPASPGHFLLRLKYDRISASKVSGEGVALYRMARMEYRKGSSRMALVAENDPGESLHWDISKNQLGADHVSGFYSYRFKGGHTILTGTFRPHFAQGLLAGGGFTLGKGRNTVAALAGPKTGITPQRTLREGGTLSGVAFSSQESRIRYGLFTGITAYDATVYSDNGKKFFHSFQFTGYHRTGAEQEKRKQVKRLTLGGYMLTRVHKYIDAGLMLQYNRINLPLRARPAWYDAHSWEGSQLLAGSTFLRISVDQWFGWIELAVIETGKTALQAAVLISLGRRWTAGILIRDYRPGYFSFDARAFGERTALPENEKGIYTGLTFNPVKRWTLSAFADMYRFPWLTYDISAPSYGSEYFLGASGKLSDRTTIMTEFRVENRLKNLPADANAGRKPGRYLTRQTGLYVKQLLTASLEWRFRFRWKRVVHGKDRFNGVAAYNELIYSRRPWTISYRFTRFHTDDYLSRIYFYERDLWGSFTLPSHQGRGMSQYVLVRYTLSRRVDLWLRYSVINRLQGNNSHETMNADKKLVSCQVRIKF